jgi:hypothetical protein
MSDVPRFFKEDRELRVIATGNTQMFLPAVHKSPECLWIDIDILPGVLNSKHPFWNGKFSIPSGLTPMELFVSSNIETSDPRCCTHYNPDGRGDVLYIAIHQNDRLSEVIVTDILDTVHLSILDPFRTKEALDAAEKVTD